MMQDDVTRRDFLAGLGALGAVWITGNGAERFAALDHARQMRASAAPAFEVFTPEQALEISAVAARIIPSDDGTPGATEAGVVYFIDKSLATFARQQRIAFGLGLGELLAAVHAKYPARKFSELTSAQQDEVLRGIEKGPFFGMMRFATISGFLSSPDYGGNRGMVGWTLMGETMALEHKAPYGWYDRPENRRRLLGGA